MPVNQANEKDNVPNKMTIKHVYQANEKRY